MTTDQRRHRRLPASIRIFTRDGGSRFPDAVKDISYGGVHVITAVPLSVGAESTFALHLPHHDAPLELEGHVVWASSKAFGVQFRHTEPKLTAFVERLELDATRL